MGDCFKNTYWESSSVLGAEVDLWVLFFQGILGHSPRTPTIWGSFSTNPLPRTGTLKIQAPQENLVASETGQDHTLPNQGANAGTICTIFCAHIVQK